MNWLFKHRFIFLLSFSALFLLASIIQVKSPSSLSQQKKLLHVKPLYDAWVLDPMDQKKSTLLQTSLNQCEELLSFYEPLIAQKLFEENSAFKSCCVSKRSMKRLGTLCPLYKEFAEISWKSKWRSLKEALQQAKKLEKSLKSEFPLLKSLTNLHIITMEQKLNIPSKTSLEKAKDSIEKSSLEKISISDIFEKASLDAYLQSIEQTALLD